MLNSKIFPILKSFRNYELKKFHLFLKSPYLNTNKKLITLYEQLIKYHPTFDTGGLSNEKLFSKLYGNKNYNESTLKNLFSDLMKVLEKYLVIFNIFNKATEEKFLLLNELNKRNLTGLTEKILDNLKLVLNNQKADSSHFYNKFHYDFEKFNFIASNTLISNVDKEKKEIESLKNTTIDLIKYLTINITNAYINSTSYDENAVTKDVKDTLNKIIHHLDIKKLSNIIPKDFILEIYAALNDTFFNFDDETKYYQYKKLVEKYTNKLSKDEISFHFITLIGYSIIKKNINKGEFANELIELFTTFLDNEYYKVDKTSHLLPERYREILVTGLQMKKYEWTNNFIEKYTVLLPAQDVENMYSWGKAYYYFYLNDFDTSLNYLNKLEYEHFIFKYDAYNIKLKIYYDKEDYKPALHLIDTFRKVLKTDKIISKERFKRYKNFLYCTEKAIQYIYKKKRVDLGYLKKKLASDDEVANKQWLLERYKFIIGKQTSEFESMIKVL